MLHESSRCLEHFWFVVLDVGGNRMAYHVRTNTLLTTAFFEAFHEVFGHVGTTKASSLIVQEEIRRLTGKGALSQDWPDFLHVDFALFRKNEKKVP
jgi:RNase P/RNase MRP subunit POP5